MNKLINDLIKELLSGLKDKIQKKQYVILKNNEKKLEDILFKELTKPSIDQSKTPTQIVNEFLYEEFNETFNFTPADFGEKAHSLIMKWGIQKTSDMNEQ